MCGARLRQKQPNGVAQPNTQPTRAHNYKPGPDPSLQIHFIPAQLAEREGQRRAVGALSKTGSSWGEGGAPSHLWPRHLCNLSRWTGRGAGSSSKHADAVTLISRQASYCIAAAAAAGGRTRYPPRTPPPHHRHLQLLQPPTPPLPFGLPQLVHLHLYGCHTVQIQRAQIGEKGKTPELVKAFGLD